MHNPPSKTETRLYMLAFAASLTIAIVFCGYFEHRMDQRLSKLTEDAGKEHDYWHSAYLKVSKDADDIKDFSAEANLERSAQ